MRALATIPVLRMFDEAKAVEFTQGLKVYVADVDGHCAQARAAGATIVSAPADGFWGGRIYRATDLEGHPWEFSQRGVDLAAELWNLPPGLRRGV